MKRFYLTALTLIFFNMHSSADNIYAVMIEQTLEVRVNQESDDAEESDDGKVVLNSSDLELINDGVDQIVGLRFQGVTVPRGVTITSAYIQFQTDEVSIGESSLTIRGQDAGDAAIFNTNANDISSRPVTTASARWDPPSWTAVGEVDSGQRTSDLSPVIQELVHRDDWQSGNSMVIILTGTGRRTAESYEGGAAKAALLHIEYTESVSTISYTYLSAKKIDAAVRNVIRKQDLQLEVGMYYGGMNYAKSDDDAVAFRKEDDFGYGTGYADINYITKPWHGFRLEGSAIGAVKLYEKNSGDWEAAYEQNAQLYEAFLQYDFSRTYVRAGRQAMRSIRFGYDAAAGISLRVGEIDRVSVLFESFWEGLEDAGYDEISKWDSVTKLEGRRGEAASDAVFSIQTEIEAVSDGIYLTPYFYVQKDFLSAFGTNAELEYRTGNLKFGIALEFLKVNENTPEVDYDGSWHAFAVEPWLGIAGFTIGAGYHKMSSVSEDKIAAYAGWLDNLNPLEEGKRVLQSKADTYYLGMSYEWKWLEVDVQLSKVDAPDGNDAEELFASLTFDASPNISSELNYYLYNDDVPEEDYQALELLLRYNF